MTAWFRSTPPTDTPGAMIGVKAADRVAILGAGDGTLAATLAAVAGLNGHAVAVDLEPGAATRVSTAAARAGALVTFMQASLHEPLPLDAQSFDLVVINQQMRAMTSPQRGLCLAEAFRLLREGGRLVVVETGAVSGLRRLTGTATPAVPPEAILNELGRSGWRASRILATIDSVSYIEAVKRR